MVGIGNELKQKAGPLPVWAWAGLGTAALAGFLLVQKKKSMDAAKTGDTGGDSSSVIGGPSSLIPTAMPMPYSQGDTFVDTTINNLPPGGSTKVTNPPPKKKPLPPVNSASSPANIPQNSAMGKTMIKIGCYDKAGHYAGHNVGGGVPVYALIAGIFKQGAAVHAKGAHCLFIPEKYKAYII